MRRSGRTTRIIDGIIQTLFTKGEAVIFDHHYGEQENLNRITRIITDRLVREHGIDRSKIKVGPSPESRLRMIKLNGYEAPERPD